MWPHDHTVSNDSQYFEGGLGKYFPDILYFLFPASVLAIIKEYLVYQLK